MKYFEIVRREGRYGMDLVFESRVTGEVFLIYFESKLAYFNVFDELKRMLAHAIEVRNRVKAGVIIFAGDQVIYNKVYC